MMPTTSKRKPNSTIRSRAASLALGAALFGVAAEADAAVVVLTYEADIEFQNYYPSDPDVAGLDGAHLVLELTFDETKRYEQGPWGPTADADAKLTITGASVAVSNGAFTTMAKGAGVYFSTFYTYEGQHYLKIGESEPTGTSATSMLFDTPGMDVSFQATMMFDPAAVPSVGDPIVADDFPTTGYEPLVLARTTAGLSYYSMKQGEFTISTVPEPTSLALLSLGGLLLVRRRRPVGA